MAGVGPADIDVAWFQGARRVGVTSGASTPTQLTRRVVEYLEALEAPAGPSGPPQAAEHPA